jgi:hypothetical protein
MTLYAVCRVLHVTGGVGRLVRDWPEALCVEVRCCARCGHTIAAKRDVQAPWLTPAQAEISSRTTASSAPGHERDARNSLGSRPAIGLFAHHDSRRRGRRLSRGWAVRTR